MTEKKSDNQSTPQVILNYIRYTWGDYFDPCPLGSAEDCFDFLFEWPRDRNKTIFINAPFTFQKKFLKLGVKLATRYTNVIILAPIGRTTLSYLYWRDYVYGKCEILIIPQEACCFGDYTTPLQCSVALLHFGAGANKGYIRYINNIFSPTSDQTLPTIPE